MPRNTAARSLSSLRRLVGLLGSCLAPVLALAGFSREAAAQGWPELGVQNVVRAEGNAGPTAFVFTLQLPAPQEVDVTVGYMTRDGHPFGNTATTADGDYVAASGNVTIPAGQTQASFTVIVNGDVANELDEYFTVQFSNAVNAIAPASTAGGILNDDPMPLLYVDDAARAEGDAGTATLSFPVRIVGLSGRTIRVNYFTADGSATAGSDYDAVTASLTIPPRTSTATIPVTIRGDRNYEPDETFHLILSNPQAVALGDNQAIGTITNDDPYPDTPVEVHEPNGGEVLRRGDPVFVHWSAGHAFDPVARVAIELSLDSGATFDHVLAIGLENGGWFLWDPIGVDTGDPAQSTARIRVTVETTHGATASDTSDAFAIANLPGRTPTAIALAPSGTQCGLPLTLIATVSPIAGGEVELHRDGVRVDVQPLDGGGQARFDLPAESSATHSYFALYRGSAGHVGSHVGLDLELAGAPTTASLSMTPPAASCGQRIDFTLQITPAASGIASFYENGGLLGQAPVDAGHGTFGYSPQSTGARTFSARFTPTGCYQESQAEIAAEVAPTATTTTLLFVPTTITVGSPLVVTARVVPVPAGGTVRFYVGAAEVGQATPANGDATVSLTLPIGAHHLTAQYGGDGCRLGSASNEAVIEVLPPASLSVEDLTMSEGDCGFRYFYFPCRLSRSTTNAVSGTAQVVFGTATASDFFYAEPGTFEIPPGETVTTVGFVVHGDRLPEGDETFQVRLSAVTNAQIADSLAIGTIVDDEAIPPGQEFRYLQAWSPVFNSPSAVGVRNDGEVWVGDRDRVRVFSRNGAFLYDWPATPQPGLLGIEFDASDVYTLHVSLKKWSASGQPLWTQTHPDLVPTPFVGGPSDIAVDPAGFIYVADTRGSVHRVTREGAYVDRWAVPGAEKIALGENRLYVSTTNHLVRVLNLTGAEVGLFTGADCPFFEITGIAADRHHVYLGELNHQIRRLSLSGEVLNASGTWGTGPGELSWVGGVAVDDHGILYVADSGNHRIQRFAPPDTTAPALTCPPDLTAPCGPSGAVVTFTIAAEDDQDPTPEVTVTPPSGSVFPVGTTTVNVTAADSLGHVASCSFQVTVQGTACPDVADVRIQSMALACSDGDSTVQYVELIADARTAFSSGLVLRAYDHVGNLRFVSSQLFPGRGEGEAWPRSMHWLIATPRFAGTLMAPDLTAPLSLDLYGGRLTLEIATAGGQQLIDALDYGGSSGLLPPVPGRAVARANDGSFEEVVQPRPLRFDGADVAFDCPCPPSTVSGCATSTIHDAVYQDQVPCSCGHVRRAFDQHRGTLAAYVDIYCKSGGQATTRTSDVFWITGPPPGTPVAVTLEFAVNLDARPALPGPFGIASASASIDCLGEHRDVTSGGPRNETLTISRVVWAHQPFQVDLFVGTNAIGFAGASGDLTFTGLPVGATVGSCHGYGDGIVSVQVSLRDVDASASRVVLRWAVTEDPVAPIVERAETEGGWSDRGAAVAEQAGVLRFEDLDVVAGRRYGHRLRWTEDGQTLHGPESWITVPAADVLALDPPRPNPSRGRLRVAFRLASDRPARLAVLDVAGRTVHARELRGLDAGPHTLDLALPRRAAPGLYFLKLEDGRTSVIRRLLVTR